MSIPSYTYKTDTPCVTNIQHMLHNVAFAYKKATQLSKPGGSQSENS